MEDHRYSRTHAHKLTLMGNSVEETSHDNQYENLGSVVKTAQQQNTLANESSGSCEYHILEEAVSNGTTIPTTSLRTIQNRLHLSLNANQTQLFRLMVHSIIMSPANKTSKSKSSS